MAELPRISRYKFIDADIDEVSERLPRTRDCVRLTPLDSTGRMSIAGCQFSIPGFDIWKMGCGNGLQARFDDPPDAYALFLPIRGSMEVRCRGRDLTSKPGTIIATELRQTELTRKHAGRAHVGVSFDRNAVKRQLSELLDAPVMAEVELANELDIGTRAYEHLVSLGNLLWRTLAAGSHEGPTSHSIEHLFRTFLVATLEHLPHRYSEALARPAPAAMPRQVKRAIDFMAANLGQPLEVGDIAREAGVSIRALQSAFQQFRETTPVDYLRRLRLEAVRRDLVEGGSETVAEAAKRYGFNHLGRFSALYRRAFGELPAETHRNRLRSDSGGGTGGRRG